MNSPPCQWATIVVTPANMSRVMSMLAPAWPGVCVADHEIIRCVTSTGDQAPLRVQTVLG